MARTFVNWQDDAPACVPGTCAGVVTAGCKRDARALSRRKDLLLDAVCSEDPGRAERALASGERPPYVCVLYSSWRGPRPGNGWTVDVTFPYEGLVVPCTRRAVERALARLAPDGIGPHWMETAVRDRILAAAGGRCWLCGKASEALSVQDLLPYGRPRLERRGGGFAVRKHDRDDSLCEALCADCARDWRACFEADVRYMLPEWRDAHWFDGLDRLVQGAGFESERSMDSFRRMLAGCVRERDSAMGRIVP